MLPNQPQLPRASGNRSNPFAALFGAFSASGRAQRETETELSMYDTKRAIDNRYNSKYYTHKTNEDIRGSRETDKDSVENWDNFMTTAGKHGIRMEDLTETHLPSGMRVGLQRRGGGHGYNPPSQSQNSSRPTGSGGGSASTAAAAASARLNNPPKLNNAPAPAPAPAPTPTPPPKKRAQKRPGPVPPSNAPAPPPSTKPKKTATTPPKAKKTSTKPPKPAAGKP